MNTVEKVFFRASALIVPLGSSAASVAAGAPLWGALVVWLLLAILTSPLSALTRADPEGEEPNRRRTASAGGRRYVRPYRLELVRTAQTMRPVRVVEDVVFVPLAGEEPVELLVNPQRSERASGRGSRVRPDAGAPQSSGAGPELFGSGESWSAAARHGVSSAKEPLDAETTADEQGDGMVHFRPGSRTDSERSAAA